jgi:hypothetical protein
MRQWDHWKAYSLELQEKLVKYEGGAPMVLNTSPPANANAGKPLTDEQIIDALHEDGCERIENFYVVGPVQKAAVFSFARAIEAKLRELNEQGEKNT